MCLRMRVMSRIDGMQLLALVAAVLLLATTGAAVEAPEGAGHEGQTLPETHGEELTPQTYDVAVPGLQDQRIPREIHDSDEENTVGRTPYMEMVRLAVSLGAVLSLVVGGAWAFKKFVPRTAGMFGSGPLKVIARTYLAPRQMVCLVSVPGKLLVVGSTQQSLSPLAEIDDPVEIERVLSLLETSSPRGASETFKNMMSSVSGRPSGGKAIEDDLADTVESVSQRVALLNNRLEAYDKDMS